MRGNRTSRWQSSQVAPAGAGKGSQELEEVQSRLRSQQRLIYAVAAILLLVAALLAGLTIALLCGTASASDLASLSARVAALEEDMTAVKAFVGMMPPSTPPSTPPPAYTFDGKPALQAAVDLWCTSQPPSQSMATSQGGT